MVNASNDDGHYLGPLYQTQLTQDSRFMIHDTTTQSTTRVHDLRFMIYDKTTRLATFERDLYEMK